MPGRPSEPPGCTGKVSLGGGQGGKGGAHTVLPETPGLHTARGAAKSRETKQRGTVHPPAIGTTKAAHPHQSCLPGGGAVSMPGDRGQR